MKIDDPVCADVLRRIEEDARMQAEEEAENAHLFDRFFPGCPDAEKEAEIMRRLGSDVEDDLDDKFWNKTMIEYLGRDAVDNAEIESVKAAVTGDARMSKVWQDIAERRQRAEVAPAYMDDGSQSAEEAHVKAVARNDKGAPDLIERVKYAQEA